MSFVVRNLQRSVPFSVERLRSHVSILVNIFEIKNYSLGVICVSKFRIKRMNMMYRNVGRPTDVLSFPNQDPIVPGQFSSEPLLYDNCLGDIFLCPAVIKGQCASEGTDFQDSLPVYVTHGICHLLGYKHGTKEDWKLMFSKEHKILSTFSQRTGIDSAPLTSYSH
ncbi:endoribonuclease YbeY-like [Dendronephthya gigantea]|uniref:endoribonuclease YbeY-like n=1 Tax=Dendronephthya gigantea TaxID=151771 RepID=UPI00106D7C58|nr:endoribonuclease YbeY-like [Dendronephthya gigantea]